MNKCGYCSNKAVRECDCCAEDICLSHSREFFNKRRQLMLTVCTECIKYAVESVRPPEKGA